MKLTQFTGHLRKLLGTQAHRRRQTLPVAVMESLETRKLLSTNSVTSSAIDRQRLEIQYDDNDNLIESRASVAGISFWLDPASESLVVTGTTSADTIEWVDHVADSFGDWMIRVSNDRGNSELLIQGRSFRSMTIFAGAGDDQVDLSDLRGSLESVSVYGQMGDDILTGVTLDGGLLDGGDGNDKLWAQVTVGVSTLNGGAGDDNVIGGKGANVINGGQGNDSLHGSYGDDTIDGGDGNDCIYGMWGNNLIRGGLGNDTVFSADGNDTIFGDAGNDVLYGGEGNTCLWGGDDQDTLFGEGGNDSLYGGAGDDLLFGGTGSDSMSGDAGNDLLFAGHYDLGTYSADKLQITRDSNGLVSNFQFDETKLTESVTNDRDVLYGGIGNDSLIGGHGRDVLAGEDGDDLLYGGANNDSLYGGYGNDCLRGGIGDDLMSGESGMDYLRGEAGNDKIYGGAGNDFLFGGSGDDWLCGGSGSDKTDGGSGANTFNSSQTTQGPGTPARPF